MPERLLRRLTPFVLTALVVALAEHALRRGRLGRRNHGGAHHQGQSKATTTGQRRFLSPRRLRG